jgi:hypothetical protein
MSGISFVTRGMICLPVTEGELITCDTPEIDEFLELKPDVVSFTELAPVITRTTPQPPPDTTRGTPEIDGFAELKPEISGVDRLVPTLSGEELVPTVVITGREEDE